VPLEDFTVPAKTEATLTDRVLLPAHTPVANVVIFTKVVRVPGRNSTSFVAFAVIHVVPVTEYWTGSTKSVPTTAVVPTIAKRKRIVSNVTMLAKIVKINGLPSLAWTLPIVKSGANATNRAATGKCTCWWKCVANGNECVTVDKWCGWW